MTEEITLSSPLKRKSTDNNVCCLCLSVNSQEAVRSTDKGVKRLKQASNEVQDKLFSSLADCDIKYHKNCYSSYILKAGRNVSMETNETETYEPSISLKSPRVLNRRSVVPHGTSVCIICNASKCHGDTKLHRICEVDRAANFIKATRYNLDSVYNRTSTLDSVESVFAADLVCHKKCINKYIVQYHRETTPLPSIDNDDHDDCENFVEMTDAFDKLVLTLELDKVAYPISQLRTVLNEAYLDNEKVQLTNRQVKRMLINKFGDSICFTYPKDRALSQMVMSVKITAEGITEKLRRESNHIKKCAEQLHDECKKYDFHMEDKFGDANDIRSSLEQYKCNRPLLWDEFFKNLIPAYVKSKNVQRKCDFLFEVFYVLVNDSMKSTPMTTALAQTIHEVTRSKTLIQMFNRLGLCQSYDAVERQDYKLVNRILASNKGKRVPVPPTIHNASPIRAAMDNFDHEEHTPSGIGGSHDTVLVIFQDENVRFQDEGPAIATVSAITGLDTTKRHLSQILPCQVLLPYTKPNSRGNIARSFARNSVADVSNDGNHEVAKSGHRLDHVWFLSRMLNSKYIEEQDFPIQSPVPGWSGYNSLLSRDDMPKTNTAFTPILPYPSTNHDTIYTCMSNLQDILKSIGQQNGSLWSDEGVYRIAKEIQLLLPQKFENLFLGLGGFHMCKCVISCLGNYLEGSGFDSVLTETETFGPVIVQSIINGSHYSRAVRGLSMFAEAMQRLLWLAFLSNCKSCLTPEMCISVRNLQQACASKDAETARDKHSTCDELLIGVDNEMQVFVAENISKNLTFRYWHMFITTLFPILRDLIRAQREGNWNLHVDALQRAIPLFFAFGKVNYARWGSVFYEDCAKLQDTFPDIYNDFIQGHFVVKSTVRKFSSVPMDQALEQNYNKPAKSQSGIIGFTRRKEAVAAHDVIRHEKVQISQTCREFCGLVEEDEYSLHHEYTATITRQDDKCISRIVDFILERGNPFASTGECATKVSNLVTGQAFDMKQSSTKLNCLEDGRQMYNTFLRERFDDKTKALMDRLPKPECRREKQRIKAIDLHKEISTALRNVDVARSRGYDIDILLTYEITSTSFYLTKDGFLRKSIKADLPHELEKSFKEPYSSYDNTSTLPSAVVIDFMSLVRSVPIKTLRLDTFGKLSEHIWTQCMAFSTKCDRIDIVCDNYYETSIKHHERVRRSKVTPIEITILGPSTPLPVNMEQFWSSTMNKMRWQNFFISWLKIHLQSHSVPVAVYVGGAHENDEQSCYRLNGDIESIEEMRCLHEEADDRLLVHVDHCTLSESIRRVLVVSKDADVYACLLYHFAQTWCTRTLCELWILCGTGKTRRAIPLHKLVMVIDPNIIHILPAIHSLTGCDTSSKIATKRAAIHVVEKCGSDLLQDFGKADLSDMMHANAEKFLTACLGSNLSTFDELRSFQYHQNKELKNDFEHIVCTSHSIRLHIARAYYQCYLWMHALHSKSAISLEPSNYGYTLYDGILIPNIILRDNLPPDFPRPCTCGKCARQTVCPCRVLKISCSQFCKCLGGEKCKNPMRRTLVD